MVTLARGLGVSMLLLWAGHAFGQVAPPAGGAAPATRPSRAAAPAAPAGVRANQELTMNAMIGSLKGEPIFLTDIFRPIDGNLRDLAARSASSAEFESRAQVLIRNSLSELESEILVTAVAESKLLEEDKDRIEIFLNLEKSKLLADYGGVESAAERALQMKGSSIAREMRAKRRAIVKQLYLERYFWPQVVVTGDMARNAYERDPKRWQQVPAVEVYTITLPVSRWLRAAAANGEIGPVPANPTAQQLQDAQAQALATGNKIAEQLKAGADFARLAEDFDSADEFGSKGGNRGTVSKGSMRKTQLEEHFFSLPANSLDVYLNPKTDLNEPEVVVIKTGQKKTARTVPFEEAEPAVFDELRQQQRRELEVQEMAKLSMGASRELEALDGMMTVAVDAAVARYATR